MPVRKPIVLWRKKLKANEIIIVADFQYKTLEAFGKREIAMVRCSTT